MSEVTTLSMHDALFQANLLDDDRHQEVLDMSGNYRVAGTLFDALNRELGDYKQIKADKYYKFTIGRGHRIQEVASALVVGSLLEVTFVNASYRGFRVDEILVCRDSRFQCRVTSVSAGAATVEPLGGVSMAQLIGTGGVQTGNQLRAIGITAETRGSDGVPGKVEVPDSEYNVCGIHRDGIQISRRDEDLKDFTRNDDNLWSHWQIDKTNEDYFRDDEKRIFLSQRTDYDANSGGQVQMFGGMEWSIQNRGGYDYPLSAAPTRPQFETFLAEMWDRKRGREETQALMLARPFWSLIGTFGDDYVKQAGKDNTFGATNGVTIPMWAVAGMKYNVVHLDLINDKQFFPEISSAPGAIGKPIKAMTCYHIDLEPIRTKGGQVAAIEKGYRGKSWCYAGFVDGMPQAAVQSMSDAQLSASMKNISHAGDYTNYQIMGDVMYDGPGQFMGMMRLTL